MAEMAELHNKKIRQMLGESGTSNSTYIFEDGSQYLFSISADPKPRVVGKEKSDANIFASDIASFTAMQNGYEFIFKDGSKFTIDLGTATKQSKLKPFNPQSFRSNKKRRR